MDKNWIHLQDGIATNLDFGYAYQYPVLLQDAAIKN